jgi:outer membrane protein OmpA-like peptidoglycan-associated protein
MAVTRYLVVKGVKADSIETIAMGETHPLASNSGAAKAKNRRVEIIVIKGK